MSGVRTASLLAWLALAVPAAFAAEHSKADHGAVARDTSAASRDGWPATREGAMARGWTQAFSSGESAFRRFLTEHQAPASLKKKSVDARMATYRENRERFGTLMLASVVSAKPGELVVSLLASDATAHEFTFELETEPPYKLVAVSRKELRRQHRFGLHH